MRWIMTIVAAGAAWILPGHLAVLAVLAYAAMAVTTNTAKARSTETRVGSLENTLAGYNSGTIPMGTISCQSLTTSGDITSGHNITSTGNIGIDGGTLFVGTGGTANIVLNPPMATPVNYPNSHISTTPTAAEFNAVVDTTNQLIGEIANRQMLIG